MDESLRQRVLVDAVDAMVARGLRVEARYPYHAIVATTKKKTARRWIVLHAALTILTIGLWGFVWLVHAGVLRTVTRYRVSVDLDGRVMQVVQTGAASDTLVN